MQVSEFENAPTSKRHPSYESSFLYTTAPEWSTGEVLVAAAYRGLVLGVGESAVDLENIGRASAAMPASYGGQGLWSRLLTERGGIASPLRHGQYSPTASRQVMPLVPAVARIAGVLGKRPRSRWNPSNLLLETIGSGSGKADGQGLARSLGSALEVTGSDDVFARFVELALQEALTGIEPKPSENAPFRTLVMKDEHVRAFRSQQPGQLSPAERFCTDLPTILALKPLLTRRQWTVLLEALLRLGLGMHALWTCNANVVLWENVLATASAATPQSAASMQRAIWELNVETAPLLELGSRAESLIERAIERYAYARTGLNLLLCKLDEVGVPWPSSIPIGWTTTRDAPQAAAEFLQHVYLNRQAIDATDAGRWLRTTVAELFDRSRELRGLASCEAGYSKNLFEFARHSLGQVEAKDPDQRCYDLAYLIAYGGRGRSHRVQPGPAMLVMLVHACCSANPDIPVSLDQFRRHLGEYGLHVGAGELMEGKSGRDLSMLGLVVDSPDAAGGRLLVRAFA